MKAVEHDMDILIEQKTMGWVCVGVVCFGFFSLISCLVGFLCIFCLFVCFCGGVL